MVYDKPLLMETSKCYTTTAGTHIPALTRVDVLAVRSEDKEDLALVRYHGTQSIFQIPLELLRGPYKEEFPVDLVEDPLESREFYERCQNYRATFKDFDQEKTILTWEKVKDFVRHHYDLPRRDKRRMFG